MRTSMKKSKKDQQVNQPQQSWPAAVVKFLINHIVHNMIIWFLHIFLFKIYYNDVLMMRSRTRTSDRLSEWSWRLHEISGSLLGGGVCFNYFFNYFVRKLFDLTFQMLHFHRPSYLFVVSSLFLSFSLLPCHLHCSCSFFDVAIICEHSQ